MRRLDISIQPHLAHAARSGRTRTRALLRVAVALLLLWGCDDAPTETASGTLRVDVFTSGEYRDADGYIVVLDGQHRRPVAPAGFVVFEDVRRGTRSLELEGVAANCEPTVPQPLEITFTGNERPQLRVLCWGTTVIHVVTASSGADPDPNGYLLTVDGRDFELPSTGSATIDEIAPGSHTAVLHGVASNCTVVGSTSRNVHITFGELGPDTVTLAFQIECVRTQKIAWHELGSVVVAYADGSNAVTVARGALPAWSPDGSQLIYLATSLRVLNMQTGRSQAIAHTANGGSSAWSPDGETIAFDRWSQIEFVRLDGNPPTILSVPGVTSARQPTWSPDGQRVAFSCFIDTREEICVVRPDGSHFERLGVAGSNPAWSPDGSRIAFVMSGSSFPSIGLIPLDGGSPMELRPGYDPAWSSDGTKILFLGIDRTQCCEGVFTMSPDGSNLVRIASGMQWAPAWRP